MKRKMLIPILATLLCVSMIGVGFAAWVIATTTTEEVSEGTQFTVYDVANKSVQFESEFTDGSVTFGTTSTTYNPQWLTLEENTLEDLEAELKITITNWDVVSEEGKAVTINVTAPAIYNGSTNVTDTYKDKYVVLPVARTITIDAGVLDTASAEAGITLVDGVLTIPMTFDWGTYFGGENPNDFYNAHKASDALASTVPGYEAGDCDTYVEHADRHLGAFYAMNGFTFKVVVTADLTVANN